MITKKSCPCLLLVILLSLIPLLSLLRPGMFWAHDSQSHVVRVAEFYKSLTEGNIVPRWAGGLNAGYGHPVLMFLYPLANYLASFFHFVGLSFTDSIKLTLATGYLGAGIFMFLWLRRHVSPIAALVGASVWQLAPYRFVNLYVRNALGENTAFLFVPLTLLAFHTLVTKPSPLKIAGAAGTLAGLILSHNAVSLMFLPFLIVYLLLLINFSSRKLNSMLYALCSMLLAFGLSAFFWIPAMVEAKYTLRDIVMQGDTFARHFPSFKQLLVPSWGYDNSIPGGNDDLSFQIGIIQWLAFIGGGMILVKTWKKISNSIRWLAIPGLVMFVVTTFLLLDISLPVWKILPLIKKFQFPWRFLIMPVFASSLLAATSIDTAQKSLLQLKVKVFKSHHTIILASMIVTILIGLVIQNYSYWRPRGDYLPLEKTVIKEYLGTTDTGESTPMWAIRFQEKRSDNILGVVWGAPITYDIITRESEVHEHTITATVPTQIAENTLYFPGWTVYVDGKKVPVIFNDISWRGVITYPVPAGTSFVRVVFEETKLRQFANALSLLSLTGIIFLIIISRIKPKFLTHGF